MTDEIMTVVFVVIALAIVVRTVFYGIQVIAEVRYGKRQYKILNRFLKKYEPLLDTTADALKDMYDKL